MNVLTRIIDAKRRRLEHAKSSVPLQELKHLARDMEQTRDFAGAIRRGGGGIRLIAEIKKASPSKGLIRPDFDPVAITTVYDEKPVNAISVLTEEDFFQGSLDYIEKVRKTSSKPVLRKDFIFDEYQIYETRANNADAVLLIATALEKNQAGEYLHLCSELGLYALFEVHDEYDLEKALLVNAGIIGINNRDLKTLKIDLSNTLRLMKDIPEDKAIVSESGIDTRDDVARLSDAGVDAMLIGTSLMKSDDIGRKIDELTQN